MPRLPASSWAIFASTARSKRAVSAFAAALAALHKDPNLSRSALYRVGGAGAGVAVRLVWGEPTKEEEFAQTGAVVKEIRADLQLSEVAAPKAGDTVESAAKIYSVVTVVKDTENLTATLTLKYKQAA